MKSALTKKLEAWGYAGNDRDFERLVWKKFAVSYAWTVDELVCNPIQALKFCRAIRSILHLTIPDFVILKTLMDARKSRRYLLY